MAVGISLDVFQLREVLCAQAQNQSFGDYRNTVRTVVAEPLDRCASEGIDDRLEFHGTIGEFFRNKSESCSGCFSDSKGEMARLSTHRDDEVPSRRRFCVGHQVLDDLYPVVTRSLVSESIDVSGKIEIIVNRFRNVDDADATGRLRFELHGRVSSVVAAYCYELRDVEMEKRSDRGLEEFS